MRLRLVGLLLGAALTSACTSRQGGDDGGPHDAGLRTPPELHLWTPDGAEGPPGAWIDTVVTASGDLGADGWSLSLEGLPEGISARFEPPELTATHGALLRLDVSPTAAQGLLALKVVATRGAHRLEAELPVTIVERTDLAADFVVQVRAPLEIGPTGALGLSLSGYVVEYPAQVLSIAGFSGEVRLLAQDPTGIITLVPSVVNVAPGVPAAARVKVRVTNEPPGGVVGVQRRTWHAASGLSAATVELAPAPHLNVLPFSRTWLQPGATAAGALRVDTWQVGTFSVTAPPVSGVSATVGAFSSGTAALTVTAASDAAPGPRELLFTASADGQQAERTARVVVLGSTSALASPELLAPLLQRDAGAPETAVALDLVIDGAGLELGRSGAGWWIAREANGFVAEYQGPQPPAAWIAGVLGGRVTATTSTIAVSLTETRGDVGTRVWSLPGVPGSRVALAYDDAKRLWCAVTVDPGVLHIWQMDATTTSAPSEVSEGLPTQVISAGPWLAAGVGPPTVAFARNGDLHVMQRTGATWSELPAVGVSAGLLPLDVELAMDDMGRVVIAWVEDAAVHVQRLESGAWVELGPVPRAAEPIPREVALVIDRGAPIVLWAEAAYEPPPQARLEGLASRLWFTRFETGAWRAPVDLQLDPEADARSLHAALGPDGKVVLAWTEDGVVVLLRGSP